MINITFTDEIEIITSTEHLYQWDVGQVLEIDGLDIGTPAIHFGVKGDTTGYAVQSQIVDGKLRCGIPDSVLQSGKQIVAYIYVSAGASKYTDRVILIPVVERNKPNNYKTVNMDEVTETQSFFDSMVDRLTALEKRVPISFWTGTQEQYDALSVKQNNCFYIITDDNIDVTITEMQNDINTLFEKNAEVEAQKGAILYEGGINNTSFGGDTLSINIPNIMKYKVLLVTVYNANITIGHSLKQNDVLCCVTAFEEGGNKYFQINGTAPIYSGTSSRSMMCNVVLSGNYDGDDATITKNDTHKLVVTTPEQKQSLIGATITKIVGIM